MKKLLCLFLLITFVFMTGCGQTAKVPTPAPKTQKPAPTEQIKKDQVKKEQVTLTLYFPNQDASALVPVKRTIDKPADLIKAMIEQLGQPGSNPQVLPANTQLLNYQLAGDTVTLNFNRAFANMGGTTSELMTINGIVDTMVNYPGVSKVKLLVEGNPLETGHNIYDQPLAKDPNSIAQ